VGTTVVIVDDQPSFREVARALLEAQGFTVLAEAGDAAGALAAVRRHQPDVVLLDVRLPDVSGTEVATTLHDEGTPTTVVLTSTVDYTYAVPACGAAAFIAKADLSGITLRAAIGAA
jgi:DNA-binding NarL/FixJ family response regulator